jgi:hypothetical protein
MVKNRCSVSGLAFKTSCCTASAPCFAGEGVWVFALGEHRHPRRLPGGKHRPCQSFHGLAPGLVTIEQQHQLFGLESRKEAM